ncbi:MAG TPA: hypothetical protein VLB29_15570 [Nocardioidaceae bacterium]|nr:hypothetical protein [Nocardioidaceae bacterium]
MTNASDVARSAPQDLLAAGRNALGGIPRLLAGTAHGVLHGTPGVAHQVDIGAPLDVVFDEWVQFQEHSRLLRVAEVVHEVLDDRIVWEAEPRQGYVDGAVTFHELAPGLTRVLVVLACDPPGLLERALGRWCGGLERRLVNELAGYRLQVMTQTLVEPEETGEEPEEPQRDAT